MQGAARRGGEEALAPDFEQCRASCAGLRRPLAGERPHDTSGKEGSRSLKRLFVDAGLSVREREETPVIYVGGRPAAALFIGVDRAFAEKGREWKYILDFYKR